MKLLKRSIVKIIKFLKHTIINKVFKWIGYVPYVSYPVQTIETYTRAVDKVITTQIMTSDDMFRYSRIEAKDFQDMLIREIIEK